MESSRHNEQLDDLLRVRLSRELKQRLEDRARSEHRTASSHTRFLIERDLMREVSDITRDPDTDVGNLEAAA